MRAQFFILGLAFVNAVLIANVNARHCYYHDTDEGGDRKDATCKENYNYCAVAEGGGRVVRSCANSQMCNEHPDEITVSCCSGDFCNGGSTTSAPPVLLLIVVFTGVIAAIGI